MARRLHAHDDDEETGIGMAVARKIVEGHGDRIRVESGRGLDLLLNPVGRVRAGEHRLFSPRRR